MATITASNAVLMLGIAGLFPTARRVQGFGVDDAFTTDAAEVSETQIGVDGYGVAGYVPRSVPMMIRLLPTSVSIDIFEQWIAAQDQLGDILEANAVIAQPSLGRKYTCYRGVLMRVDTIASVRKVLANREFHLNWLPQGTIPAISAAPM